MEWTSELIERLVARVPGGYGLGGEPATEPTALAGLAIWAHGMHDEALAAASWIADLQSDSGAVGVGPSRPTPCWPTSLAILLWRVVGATDATDQFASCAERAVAWALAERGRTHPQRPFAGHDTTLVGWSWAANTHSWLEPTALFVLALKAAGHASHPRTREAVRLLVDRLLPSGGCNYGNTIVLGQELLAHVQPTGLVLLALAGEKVVDQRIERSLAYLEQELSSETTTASLCYGLLGLAAHGRSPAERLTWLENSYRRASDEGPSTYRLSLLALAALDPNPLQPATSWSAQ